jgi:DNA-binding LacI/PurR family transcriptional regulator
MGQSAPSAPSLKDVADAAGVSLTTASRAINNAYGVSAATRSKVLETAKRLDFVASPEAERLARGTMNRVALVVPHIERWFFGEIVAGIERELSEAGVDILLYHVDGPEDRRDFFERLPARRKVDAVIAIAFPVDEGERQRLELMGVGVTAAGGQMADYPYVCIDDYLAGRQAMDHLLGLGHRRVAMIASTEPNIPNWPANPGRARAYVEALAEHGVPFDADLVREVDWGARNAADAMRDILAGDEPPTAVYAHSDELALGAIHEVRRHGLRVPEDVSVVGIDDHPLAELFDLTTVQQPVREQGTIAARLVLESLHSGGSGREDRRPVVVPTRLVVRGTTAVRPDRSAGSDAAGPS